MKKKKHVQKLSLKKTCTKITGGKYLGKILETRLTNASLIYRNTTNIVRKALFDKLLHSVCSNYKESNCIEHNILSKKMSPSTLSSTHFFDLCCGSGACGIEAVSRGFGYVTFCDIHRDAIALTRRNLSHLSNIHCTNNVSNSFIALKNHISIDSMIINALRCNITINQQLCEKCYVYNLHNIHNALQNTYKNNAHWIGDLRDGYRANNHVIYIDPPYHEAQSIITKFVNCIRFMTIKFTDTNITCVTLVCNVDSSTTNEIQSVINACGVFKVYDIRFYGKSALLFCELIW